MRLTRFSQANSFLKNIFLLAGGTAAAQAVLFLLSPVISRLYSPESFGILGVYTACISILSVFSTLRFELALMVEKDGEKARDIARLAMALNALVAVLVAVLIAFVYRPVNELFGFAAGSLYLFLIPAGIWGLGISNIYNYWFMRESTFPPVAQSKMLQSGVMGAGQILLGLMKLGPYGLLAGDALSRMASGFYLYRRSFTGKRKTPRASLKMLWARAREYKNFAMFSVWSGSLYVLVNQSPPVLITLLYGAANGGLYAFGMKIVNAPMVLVGKAVSQVYLSECRKSADSGGRMLPLFKKVTKRLLLVGLIPYTLLAIFGDRLFKIVFGASWEQAGVFMQLLALMFLIEIVVYPIMETLEIIGKQRLLFLWQFVRALFVLSSIAVPYAAGLPVLYAIGCFSAAMAISYVILYVLIYAQLTKQDDA